MKAISLYEPWATFIMLGWKTIETRTHVRFRSLEKETILIHAARKVDGSLETLKYLNKDQLSKFREWVNSHYFRKTLGKLLGSVYVSEFKLLFPSHSQQALIDCDPDDEIRYGIILERPCPLVKPIPYKGHQGIFNVPDDIIAAGVTK